MDLNKICNFMNNIAPEENAYSFDNVGLIIQGTNTNIKKILLALDVNNEVVSEAIANNVDLIIAHHPLIFGKINKIQYDQVNGRRIIDLIQNNINVYCSHTNLDRAPIGTNGVLFNKLNLINKETLNPEEEVDNCLGLVGELENKLQMCDFLAEYKKIFDVESITYYGDEEKLIQKIGLITGSGCDYEYIDYAKNKNCDLYITGDITYHKAQYALDNNINLIDGTHFGTEIIVLEDLCNILKSKFDVEIMISKDEKQIQKEYIL